MGYVRIGDVEGPRNPRLARRMQARFQSGTNRFGLR